MKPKNHLLFPSLLTLALTSGVASAQNVYKNTTTNALNAGSSYVGGSAPAANGTDTLNIDAANFTANTTSALGGNVSVLGIAASSGFNLTVSNTANATLAIGAGGITRSGAGALTFGNAVSLGGNVTGAVTFNGALTLTANQSWGVGTGRAGINNGLTTGGNTLNISANNAGVGILDLRGTTTLDTNVTIGTMDRIYVQSGNITFDGVNNTASSFFIFGGTANIASMGNLTGASSIGKGAAYIQAGTTLNYKGNTASSDKGFSRDVNGTSTIGVTTSGQTLSMSGNLTTNTGTTTGGWSFGGAGNLSLSGNILNGNATTVTKTGNGTLTLSGATNAYAGQTTVSAGKLTIASTGNINSTSAVSIGAAEFNYNSSTALSKGVSFSSTGGTLSGNGTITPAVNVTAGNTLAIGNSIGAMSFGGNLTVGGTYSYELNNTTDTADLGDVGGNLTLGGILDLVQLGTYALGDKFTLFAYDGSYSGLFKEETGTTTIGDDTQFTDAGGIWEINYNDTTAGINGGSGTSYVTITAIPEPNVAALLGGLGTLLLLRRRR